MESYQRMKEDAAFDDVHRTDVVDKADNRAYSAYHNSDDLPECHLSTELSPQKRQDVRWAPFASKIVQNPLAYPKMRWFSERDLEFSPKPLPSDTDSAYDSGSDSEPRTTFRSIMPYELRKADGGSANDVGAGTQQARGAELRPGPTLGSDTGASAAPKEDGGLESSDEDDSAGQPSGRSRRFASATAVERCPMFPCFWASCGGRDSNIRKLR